MTLTKTARDRARPYQATRALLGIGLILAAYVFTRYFMEAPWAESLSQAIFLAPVFLAAVLLALASRAGPPLSRTRRTWACLAVSAGGVFVGEAAWSYAQLFLPGGPDEATVVFDAANAVAIISMVCAVAVHSGVDRLGWRRSARIVLDATALMALAFGVLYRFWATRLISGPDDALEAARLASYGVIALLLLAGDAGSFGRRGSRGVPHNAVLTAAIAVLATGVALWAGTGLAYERGVELAVAASSVLLLAAYCLMGLAAWLRLIDVEASRRTPAPAEPPLLWPGVVVTAAVLVSVVWLGFLALEAETGSRAEAVYLAAASIAALCVVGRTALTYAEADELTERSLSDPVTAARGPRGFDPELASLLALPGAHEGSVAVFAIDLDDFARVNAVHGYRAGDRCLIAVARALEATAGDPRRVFRLRGDEFVVIGRFDDGADAERMARSLLAAVRAAECDVPVTASVGVALFPVDANDAAELLRCARLSSLWAKRHGKDRSVRYEARIGDTLTLDERLARPGDRARMDMARALLAAADARDSANHAHARNVAALARLLAEDLALDPSHVDRVEMAAILHDVGKIALPDVMLGGRTLTFQERSVAREHARLGERLVDSLAVEGVGRWVRAHHEHWDGSGYPDALEGEQIPIEARIIALADAYDGMTMGKRYGAPMSKAAALQEIDLGIGVRFDPGLAERFIRVVGTTGALGWSDDWPAS